MIRVRDLLEEAAPLIEELRGGEPARRFRKWLSWWTKVTGPVVGWRAR